MTTEDAPDAVDTRTVLRAYFVLVGAAGFVLFAWGPGWLGTSLTSETWAKVVLIRLSGGVVMAAACAAWGFSRIEDSATRHRALLGFVLAHGVLLAAWATQWTSLGIPGPGDIATPILCALAILLLYFWQTGDGYRARDIFADTDAATKRLRSKYEEQIREAAGQEERNRLARELHDSIKQQIFVMQTAAATAQARFDSDPAGATAALSQLRDAARDAMTEMEAMLDNLRATPLENLGLMEALRKQCEALALRTGAEVRFEPGDLPPSQAVAPGAQQVIFRVAQEALANIGRHARASVVRLALQRRGREVVLAVDDNGVGFDPDSVTPGMGLRNIAARAASLNGHLTVRSRPGDGSHVQFSLPCRPRGDVSTYRRRLIIWASALALFAAAGVVQIVRLRYMTIGAFELLFFGVPAVIFARVLASYRRALRASQEG